MGFLKEVIRYARAFQEYLGWRLYVVFFLSGTAALAEGFGIALLLPFFYALDAGDMSQAALDGRAQRILFGIVEFLGISDSVVGILLFIGAVFIAKGFLRFIDAVYKGFLQCQLVRELKSRLFQDYSRMSYQYYVRRSTGHFLNVIGQQVDGLYGAFFGFTTFWVHVLTTVLYVSLASLLAWRFALFALIVGAIVLSLFRWLNLYVRSLSRRVASEVGVLNNLFVQALHGFKYLVATDQTPRLRGDVAASIGRHTSSQFRLAFAGAFTRSMQEPFGIFLILSIVVVQVVLLDAPLAPILVSLLLVYRSMGHIIGIQLGWQATVDKIAALEMVTEEFEMMAEWREPNGSRRIPELANGIEFRDVTFAYDREGPAVLQNISLTIPANATVAFVGESGAGKSTLIDMLTLMLRPVTGEILIDGVPGSEVELSSWRSQIGYVSQEVVMFDETAANNICLWEGDYDRDPDIQRRVHDAARRAYAHRFLEELPNGYRTLIGDRGVRLSGGQRQRLFIARELYKNPRLLILDEATSALDSDSERFIQKSLETLRGKTTIVLIAHRLSTIKEADYIYVLDQGKIIEQGDFAELTSRNSRFQRMVEVQQL